MPLWKHCSKSWCPRVPAASPFCGPGRERASHSSAVPIPRPAPSQVEGRLVSAMGTQKSLLLPLLAISWQYSGPVRALKRTRPLAVEMGRLCNKRALSRACCFCSQRRPPVLPATGPIACRHYHRPFDIPAGGPEIGVEQREEGGRAGRKGGLRRLCVVSFGSGIFLSPSRCPWTFGNMTGLLPKTRTRTSAIPTPEGCAAPSGGSEQPWRLPVLSSSETWKPNPVSLGLESQQFSSLPSPVAAPWL